MNQDNLDITQQQEAALKKLYYGDMPFGRDKLYYELRQRMPANYPLKNQINHWLKKQRVHTVLRIPKKAKTVTSFRTMYPFHYF